VTAHGPEYKGVVPGTGTIQHSDCTWAGPLGCGSWNSGHFHSHQTQTWTGATTRFLSRSLWQLVLKGIKWSEH